MYLIQNDHLAHILWTKLYFMKMTPWSRATEKECMLLAEFLPWQHLVKDHDLNNTADTVNSINLLSCPCSTTCTAKAHKMDYVLIDDCWFDCYLPCSQLTPLYAGPHMHIPWMQVPWLEQVGSMHWPSSTLHSAPFHPGKHTHLPFSYTPFPLHKTGHESATGQTQITLPYSVLQYISQETAVTHRERGYALLSQLAPGFSKSSSSLCLPLSFPRKHSHGCERNARTHSSFIPHAVSIYSSTTWARLPRQPRNCRKSPPTSPHSLWAGRENNRENGRLGKRALGL